MSNEMQSENPSGSEAVNASGTSNRPRWRGTLTLTYSRLMIWGRWLLVEAWAVAVATAAQSWRLIQYGIAVGRCYTLRRAFHNAQLSLGEQMYRDGVGEDSVRTEIRRVDEQIREARIASRPATSLLAQRKRLVDVLAKSSLATTEPGSGGRHRDEATSLQHDLERMEEAARTQQADLFPSAPQERWRILVGIGVILLAVIGFYAIPGSRPASDVGAIAAELKADLREIENPSHVSSHGTPHFVPPKVPTAIESGGGLPGTGFGFGMGDNEIVGLVTKPTSHEYLQAGFKEFRFGASLATVQSLAAKNEVPTREGGQDFFVEDGKLIGYGRLYLHNNEGYLGQFREVFGGALEDNISKALATRQMSTTDGRGNVVPTVDREDTLLVRYYFPRAIAYLEATWQASAQANIISVQCRERLVLNIFDRGWVDAQLSGHVSKCRDALQWGFTDCVR